MFHFEQTFVLIAELKETLNARAGVLRAHALVAVRKQHDQAALRSPFLLTCPA